MILFWFIAALMVLLALWFILPALWQSSGGDTKSDTARAANLLVYQDQLREMEADLKTGLLSQAQYDQDKEELERRLLEDVSESARAKAGSKMVSRKLAYAVAIAIPVVAITLYLFIGKPETLNPNVVNSPNMRTR